MELLIVTGMSGAGKTKAINALEDLGYFCADNVPPVLIKNFLDLYSMYDNDDAKIAVVVDVRGGQLFDEIDKVLSDLKKDNINYKLLFIDANNDILLKRYKESRRRHPLMSKEHQLIEDAILREKELLLRLKQKADYVVDTSNTPPNQLRLRITELFSGKKPEQQMFIHCMSFGYKNGLPSEADLVIDVRGLDNPFYDSNMRELTGLDESVRDFVLINESTQGFISRLFDFLDYSIPLYASDAKSQLVIAIGCTGGRHRSVAIAEELKKHLVENGFNAAVTHRDIQKSLERV